MPLAPTRALGSSLWPTVIQLNPVPDVRNIPLVSQFSTRNPRPTRRQPLILPDIDTEGLFTTASIDAYLLPTTIRIGLAILEITLSRTPRRPTHAVPRLQIICVRVAEHVDARGGGPTVRAAVAACWVAAVACHGASEGGWVASFPGSAGEGLVSRSLVRNARADGRDDGGAGASEGRQEIGGRGIFFLWRR